jgi:hypothetical protein
MPKGRVSILASPAATTTWQGTQNLLGDLIQSLQLLVGHGCEAQALPLEHDKLRHKMAKGHMLIPLQRRAQWCIRMIVEVVVSPCQRPNGIG